MKIITSLAIGTAVAALAACSSNKSANNIASENTSAMNAGMTEMNATTEMNAAGNTELNAAGANATANAMGNMTTNNHM